MSKGNPPQNVKTTQKYYNLYIPATKCTLSPSAPFTVMIKDRESTVQSLVQVQRPGKSLTKFVACNHSFHITEFHNKRRLISISGLVFLRIYAYRKTTILRKKPSKRKRKVNRKCSTAKLQTICLSLKPYVLSKSESALIYWFIKM